MNRKAVVAAGDADVASQVCDFLRQEGDDVSSTAVSAEALALVASDRPWLLVVGEKLQDGEGCQLLRNAALTLPVEHLPFVILIYTGMPTHAHDGPSWIHLADVYIGGPFRAYEAREFRQMARRLRHEATRVPGNGEGDLRRRALVKTASRLKRCD